MRLYADQDSPLSDAIPGGAGTLEDFGDFAATFCLRSEDGFVRESWLARGFDIHNDSEPQIGVFEFDACGKEAGKGGAPLTKENPQLRHINPPIVEEYGRVTTDVGWGVDLR